MSVFFYVWLFISLFLLGFWLWTLYVVLQQKRAWKHFAENRKMRYHETGMFTTPMVSGAIDTYGVSLFASEHSELDARSFKRLTAIEVALQSDFPFSCAIASGGMVSVVDAFDIRHEFKPTIKGWDNSYILRASDTKMVRHFLSDERLEKILGLMAIDKAWVILAIIEDRGILRLDTPYPIDSSKELDKLISQMIDIAQTLEMQKGEDKDLARKNTEKGSGNSVLDVDEDILDDNLGIELED